MVVCHFFAVKTLPFADTSADSSILVYAHIATRGKTLYSQTLEVIYMRHFYFRLILGVVFVICAVYSFITANIPFALMYVVLGGVFLYSAYTIRKKNKGNRR